MGVEGLALGRHLYDGSVLQAEQRPEEIRGVLDEGSCASMPTPTLTTWLLAVGPGSASATASSQP
jgi:hypothetical protein